MRSFRRLATIPWVQKAVAAAEYLRLAWKTSSFAIDPVDIYERIVPDLPVIAACGTASISWRRFFAAAIA